MLQRGWNKRPNLVPFSTSDSLTLVLLSIFKGEQSELLSETLRSDEKTFSHL